MEYGSLVVLWPLTSASETRIEFTGELDLRIPRLTIDGGFSGSAAVVVPYRCLMAFTDDRLRSLQPT